MTRRSKPAKRRSVGRPSLGADARSVVKTIRLSRAELDAQLAAIGDAKWTTWAHDTLVAVHPPEDE